MITLFERIDLVRLIGRVATPSWRIVRWHLSRLATPNGILILLGLLGGLAAETAYWLEVPSLRDRAAELKTKIDAVEVVVVAKDETPAPVVQLESYYGLFPPATSRAQILGQFFEIAAQQKVQLAQGAYSLKNSRSERLNRYEVTFPIKGSYAQIRAFALQVTRDVPNIALESMSFQRKTASEAAVQAQIKFVVLMRAGGPQ